MSLKGYQWIKDGKVIMWYSSKYNKIYVNEDIRSKDEIEFIKYLKEQGINCNSTDYQGHSNLDINEAVTNKLNNYLNGEL